MSDSHETKALAIIPRTIDEATALAERLSKSSLLPKSMQGKMPDVLMTILAGQEMGLSPMASLRSFHVIEGKPVISADGMVAIVLGSGKAVYFRRFAESDTSVTYETLRVGDTKPRTCTWTREMVKLAGLNTKDNHRLYSRQMLAARAKAELARDVYPDVLAGCYVPDEAAEWRAPADVVDAEFVETPAENEPAPLEILAIEHTASEAELKAMAPVLKALPQKWKELATEKFKARLAWHREQAKEGAA
jgi:hypothetical protein